MARRNLNVRITDEAYEGWQAFAGEHGVSVSAVIEALGERFANSCWVAEDGAKIVERAREIDRANRSRRR